MCECEWKASSGRQADIISWTTEESTVRDISSQHSFPEYLWPLHRRWRCWKSREWHVVSCPELVFNSLSVSESLFLFIWGISGIGALSFHWVLLRSRACFRHGVGHHLLFCLLLSCLGLEESLLQALAFTAVFSAPSGISLLPGWVLALISRFLWIQASFLMYCAWCLLNGSIVVFCMR